MPTVDEAESNGVLDRFPTRKVDVVDFHDCSQGLGLKIFGGISVTGVEHGIFVKQLVPGGLASVSGRLKPGDQLLEVNGRPLSNITNSRAVSMLRACAAQRILTLVISRDPEASQGYHRLCSETLSGSTKSLNVSDEIPVRSRTLDRWGDSSSKNDTLDRMRRSRTETDHGNMSQPKHQSSSKSSPYRTPKENQDRSPGNSRSPHIRSELEENSMFAKKSLENRLPCTTVAHDETESNLDDYSEGQISPISQMTTSSTQSPTKTVTIEYRTGLGMSICGGTNKAEGPGIYIDSVINGGDVDKHGALRAGDELISVNGQILQGLPHERAMKILTRLKLRQVKQVEIIYRAGTGISPRQKSPSRNNSAGANSLHKSSNGISRSVSLKSRTSTGIQQDMRRLSHGSGPSKSLVSASQPGPQKLSGTSGTKSITDTASTVLNTKLDEGSAPLRTRSLAPSQQISMEKLVVALQYLGYNPTQSQLNALKNKLNIDANNKVRYSEFVEAAREVFAYKLKEDESKQMLKSDSMDEISRSRVELHKSLNTINDYKSRGSLERSKISALSNSVPNLSAPSPAIPHSEELRSASSMTNPASNLLDHVASSSRMSTSFPAAQVSSVMPSERLAPSPALSATFSTRSGWTLPQYDRDLSACDPSDIIKECAILAAELRKAEKVIMQYKAITEKLVSFACNVQSSFKAEVSRSRSLERGTSMDRSRTRQSLATVIHGANKTVQEAQEILHEEHLPPGWEEAFTEDGAKYYINHFSQTTSWDKPNG